MISGSGRGFHFIFSNRGLPIRGSRKSLPKQMTLSQATAEFVCDFHKTIRLSLVGQRHHAVHWFWKKTLLVVKQMNAALRLGEISNSVH